MDNNILNSDEVFQEKRDFYEHLGAEHNVVGLENLRVKQCPHCPRRFRPATHFIKYHSAIVHKCNFCALKFSSHRGAANHARDRHSLPVSTEFREIESAFQRRVQTFSRSFARQQYVSLDQVF